jgi:MFS family permease
MIAESQNPQAQGTPPGPQSALAASPTERVNFYHWLVVILAAGGWLFDCMGQRIFVLGRNPAMRELLGGAAPDAIVGEWGTRATFALMIGWATGGIIFGMFSDRFGRVKTMVITLVAYTVFSAISGFAHSVTEFLVYRFLFGLGVGGMFGAATTLVAESVPKHFRTVALGSMQALSALGNMSASALSLKIIPGQENFWGHFSGWQVLFFAGMAPIILALPMLVILKEPEPWRRARTEAASGAGKRVGSIADVFAHPRWRKSAFIGICFGLSGMVGLWGIAFFSPELIRYAMKTRALQTGDITKPAQICSVLKSPPTPAVEHLKSKLQDATLKKIEAVPNGLDVPQTTVELLAADLNRVIQEDDVYDEAAFRTVNLEKATTNLVHLVQTKPSRRDVTLLNRQLIEQTFPGSVSELQITTEKMIGRGTFLQDVGALCGMFVFTFLASALNRRSAFFIAFLLCLFSVSFVFYSLKTERDVYWMLPLMGFATLMPFAGYSIYFPEIFPTRLRGTGVGFCYNTVRYVAAPFPLLLGKLSTFMPFRTVAVMMATIYLVGIVALIWAPETKGKPLPED